jgi:hypothetical protein
VSIIILYALFHWTRLYSQFADHNMLIAVLNILAKRGIDLELLHCDTEKLSHPYYSLR